MKLLTKTNSYTSIIAFLLFATGAFIIYKIVLNKLDKGVDEQLLSTKQEVISELKNGVAPKDFLANIGQKIYVREIYKQTQFVDKIEEYKQTIALGTEKENETLRELTFQTTISNNSYEINISSSVTAGEKLGNYIILVVLIIFLFSIIVLYVLNRFVSASLFSPFYDTLSKIKTWNIKRNEILQFKNTNIEEFNLLNDTVKDLTQQITSDYKRLKEFTENVSHEAQTPLSIISTKIELLMQEADSFTPKQGELLQQTYQATQRLYKLNQALILLSRIENKQFVEINKVNINDAIEEKLEVLEDFIEAKNISIEKDYKFNLTININEYLLSIMLNNLFINAIKYSPEENGKIKIAIDENSFSVENKSFVDKIDKDFLFERFNKTSTSGSLGVGLSLIKKIVDFYNWQITYRYKEGIHKFKIYI